jgi:hypothetical protein
MVSEIILQLQVIIVSIVIWFQLGSVLAYAITRNGTLEIDVIFLTKWLRVITAFIHLFRPQARTMLLFVKCLLDFTVSAPWFRIQGKSMTTMKYIFNNFVSFFQIVFVKLRLIGQDIAELIWVISQPNAAKYGFLWLSCWFERLSWRATDFVWEHFHFHL